MLREKLKQMLTGLQRSENWLMGKMERGKKGLSPSKSKRKKERNLLLQLMRIKLENDKTFKIAFSSQHNWISCSGSKM